LATIQQPDPVLRRSLNRQQGNSHNAQENETLPENQPLPRDVLPQQEGEPLQQANGAEEGLPQII